ncbi:MAG: Uma2 family endonuclease [Verrucomicrobiaceae bacterium]|nr:Uma2 family endonuclease [Verrucomicrobiaceae bacterium]
MALLIKAPGFHQRALPLSVAAWHEMIAKGLAPRRAELIRGVIIEKMSKSIIHSKLAGRMAKLLEHALGERFWVRREDPITLSDSEPEPDVSVIGGPESDYPSHPTTAKLVVEVSVSTLADDREMAEIYAEAGVEEYWIINATDRCIEIRRQPAVSGYDVTEVISTGFATCASLPGVVVSIDDLFANLPTA